MSTKEKRGGSKGNTNTTLVGRRPNRRKKEKKRNEWGGEETFQLWGSRGKGVKQSTSGNLTEALSEKKKAVKNRGRKPSGREGDMVAKPRDREEKKTRGAHSTKGQVDLHKKTKQVAKGDGRKNREKKKRVNHMGGKSPTSKKDTENDVAIRKNEKGPPQAGEGKGSKRKKILQNRNGELASG